MERLKAIWKKAINYFPKMSKRTKPSLRIIYIYGAGLVIMTIAILLAWIYQWYITGKADIPLLISFFKEYSAPAVVGAFTFVSVFIVDKDKNGRSDAAERKSNDERD